MINRVKRVLKNPSRVAAYLIGGGIIFRALPDKSYIKLNHKLRTGKSLDLENPRTFNEKLQWLKLNNRIPHYSNWVDKYEVRKYIANTIGEEYLIPLIGMYESFEEIDFDSFPEQFVLKPNHTSGDVYICRNKSEINISELKKQVNSWLKREFYWTHREWPYKNVKPKIVCEKYMVDESGIELKDYKIYCFGGVPKIIQVDYNRFQGHKRNLYDVKWNYISGSIQYPSDSKTLIKKPEKLNTMLNLAEILSKDCPFVRVDFYSINSQIYFGELTFYPEAGLAKFEPESLGIKMGDWIKLPKLN